MSTRGQAIRLRQKMKARLDERQPLLERWVGLMGDGEGNLYPDPTDETYVFVRRSGRGRVERVRNTRVMARNNLPVIVGFAAERPDEQQVLDMDDVALTTLGAYGYVKNHHQQHELLNPTGGDDTVWVFTQQFLYLLAQVTDPVSLQLDVRSGLYLWQGNRRFFPGATTVDLSVYAPGVAGQAVMVLVYIDAATGTLGYDDSPAFSTALPESMRYSQVPLPPDGSIPVAGVYVPNGIVEVDWENVYDWRIFINTIADIQTHNILSATHADSAPNTLVGGDVLAAGTGATPLLERLAIGAWNQVFRVNAGGTFPEWGVVPPGAMPHTLLDGTAHTDTAIDTVSRGSLIYGNATPRWDELVHPGALYHFQTDANDVVWNQNITMTDDAWIGLGAAAGRIEFDDQAEDEINILDAHVGIGTQTPNITGEARALTIESATGPPVLELSLRDDIFPADQIVGLVRWIAGDVDQCTVGQIDVVQTGWYETESIMRFWAADGCALCLRQEISCEETRMGDIAGGNYISIRENGELDDPGRVQAAFSQLPALRGFWPMSSVDYTAANRGIDLSGQGNHLTDNNTVEFGYDGLAPYVHLTAANNEYLSRADGGAGNWADILGTETYIEAAYRGLTCGGWVYLGTTTGANRTIISKVDVANDWSYWLEFSNAAPANVFRFAMTPGGILAGLVLCTSSVPISESQWYFVVGRFNPSTETAIFVNDTKDINAVGIPAAIHNGIGDLRVGALDPGGGVPNLWNGRVSMCFLCAAALSDDIILGLYERTRGMFGV